MSRMVPRSLPERPPIPIPGAIREVVITPVAWHIPARDDMPRYIDVLYDCFPDLIEFTVGISGVRVKLLVFSPEQQPSWVDRCREGSRRLFGLWVDDSRQRALDAGTLEEFRAEAIAMVDERWR